MTDKVKQRIFEGKKRWVLWQGPLLAELTKNSIRFWDDPMLNVDSHSSIEWYIGVEVHKLRIVFAVYGRLQNFRILGPIFSLDNVEEAWQKLPEKLDQFPPKRFLMETTGIYHFQTYWRLCRLFQHSQIYVMNATDVSHLITSTRQSDNIDATRLAQIASFDELIRPSYVPDRNIAILREQCRSQQKLIWEKTQIINRLKKVLDQHGSGWKFDATIKYHLRILEIWFSDMISLEKAAILAQFSPKIKKSLSYRSKKVKTTKKKEKTKKSQKIDKFWMSIENWKDVTLTEHVRHHLQFLLGKLMSLLEFQKLIEKQIVQSVEICPTIKTGMELIHTLPGCKYLSRIALLSEIGVISRFRNARAFLSYCGIAPSGKTSGVENIGDTTEKTVIKDHPNQKCNRRLKLILLTAARAILRSKETEESGNDLEIYAMQIKHKNPFALKRHFKVAAKLGRKLFICLKTDQIFDSNYESRDLKKKIERTQQKMKNRQYSEKFWLKQRMNTSWASIEQSLISLGIKAPLISRFAQNLLEETNSPAGGIES